MRGIVEVTNDPSTWLDLDKTASDLRRDVSDLIDNFLLGVELDEKISALNILSGNLREHEKSLLEICLRQIPQAGLPDSNRADFSTISSGTSSKLNNTAMVNAVRTLARSRCEAFPDGTTNTDAYERSLAPFVRLAKRVEIMDPYSGSSILSLRENRIWFLRKLLEANVPVVELTLCVPAKNDSLTHGLTIRQKVEAIVNAGRVIRDQVTSARSILIFNFYLPDPRVFHNRRMRLSFDSGSLAVALDNGIDGLGQNPIAAGSKHSPMSGQEFQLQLGAIQTVMKNRFIARLEL
jgi:hypothetical protein